MNKIDKLAALHHEAWKHWTTTLVNELNRGADINVLIKKWGPNWRPFEELSEKDKEKARAWGRQAYNIVNTVYLESPTDEEIEQMLEHLAMHQEIGY